LPLVLPDPEFPPLLTGHAVPASRDPFQEACRRAQAREIGAGDVVWSVGTASADLAIVLEPEVGLDRAVQMAPLMMVALGDCLGALGPPKLAVQYRWPTEILLNGSVAGDVRLACPRVPAAQVPEWLVVGARLAIAGVEARTDWSRTSLAEEAGADLTRTDILQSLAAHFLTRLNAWSEDGFRPVHDQWLFRAEGRETSTIVVHQGKRIESRVLGLDESVNLIIEASTGERMTLGFLSCVEIAG
jgi:BirA family transcriptional regulator, biotin operon repressor / biotin---[acetyl-CoA-carboxylase] ligase